mgnify:CR=1 FL=1
MRGPGRLKGSKDTEEIKQVKAIMETEHTSRQAVGGRAEAAMQGSDTRQDTQVQAAMPLLLASLPLLLPPGRHRAPAVH